MITIEGGDTNLARIDNGTISKQNKVVTVGMLERALLVRYPRDDAEPWDRTGLLVGDPAAAVTGVAVALDVTKDAIRKAKARGANVLLTHHPAYLDPPSVIAPSYSIATASGVNAYTAVTEGVALMNFHTALDASRETSQLLSSMMGLEFDRVLNPKDSDANKGYWHLCRVPSVERSFTLSHLAARCTSVFGRMPRVWGDFENDVKTVVIANGSAGDAIPACLRFGADCLVCGEVRYHAALDAMQAGLSIVELGHDASELPLTALLAQAAVDAGVPSARVSVIDQSGNWTTPESTRL